MGIKALPSRGHAQADVLAAMEGLRDRDVRWRDGRVFSLVFHVDDEFKRFVHQAYGTFMAENGLNPSAFPSLRRMENEVVSMTGRLLGGGPDAVGNMTSGGTESILVAVKGAVEWGRVHRPRVRRPQMVLPRTAHPAFEKASHYFGIEPVFVPVRDDYRVDVRKVRRALNRRTVLVVGSAPQYPQGVVHPGPVVGVRDHLRQTAVGTELVADGEVATPADGDLLGTDDRSDSRLPGTGGKALADVPLLQWSGSHLDQAVADGLLLRPEDLAPTARADPDQAVPRAVPEL